MSVAGRHAAEAGRRTVRGAGAGLRRLSDREKTLLVDRLRPAYSLRSMTCLLAIAPGGYHCHHARLGVDKYAGSRQSRRP